MAATPYHNEKKIMEGMLFLKSLGALFAIMNPFIVLPLFLSMTDKMDAKTQRSTAIKVAISSTVLCVIIAFSGQHILEFFGIEIDDFRVAGGIVLMLISLGMLNGNNAPSHCGSSEEDVTKAVVDDISFYPLTFPMTIGPGTIATIIVFTGLVHNTGDAIALGSSLAIVLAAMTVVLWFASDIGRHMSQNLRVIMTRIMGMILAAISVEMVVDGLQSLFPGLMT